MSLRALQDHAHLIPAFMDYVPLPPRGGDLARDLRRWFNNPDWAPPGERFTDLGFDGTGGRFVGLPGGEVAYLGSEGGCGVLARTLADWLLIVGHAPRILEHSAPATSLYVPPGARAPAAQAALESYRRAAGIGSLPPLEALVAGLEPRSVAFVAWVRERTRTFSARDLDAWRLSGAAGAAARRRAVADALGVPYGNARAFLRHLNASGLARSRVVDLLQALDRG